MPFNNVEAQVSVGGQIDIRIGLPEVVVINRAPQPRRVPQPRRRPPIVVTERVPAPRPCDCDHSLGTIMNQNNGPRFDYYVLDASVNYLPNHELDLILNLDTGDTMVISMIEVNPQDYNFHYHCNPRIQSNTITAIHINNAPIALHSAAVSLQPNSRGFNAVLNLHSVHNGDYNGTVGGVR